MKLLKLFLSLGCCTISATNLSTPNEHNALVQKGKEFVQLVHQQSSSWYLNCHKDIFEVLDNLTFEEDKKLYIVTPQKEGLGDISHIRVEGIPDQEEPSLFQFMDGIFRAEQNEYMAHVLLKDISAESLWQWILLSNIRYFTPVFWHGGYIKKTLILTDNDYQAILPKGAIIPDSDYNKEIEAGEISESQFREMAAYKITPPQITIHENAATITFYTWNNWTGLSHNRYELQINENKTVAVLLHEVKVVVPYHCGITF